MSSPYKGGRAAVRPTLENLRECTLAQAEVIARLEAYQRVVFGLTGGDESRTGFRNGYVAELGYLRVRRTALDSLIEAVERYGAVAKNSALSDSGDALEFAGS